MALIKCPECGNQVSNTAASCPQCGAPIAAGRLGTPLNTIQKTSKKLKLQQALAGVFFSVAIIVFIFNAIYASQVNVPMSTGVIVWFVLGFFWYLVVKIRIWWHHE